MKPGITVFRSSACLLDVTGDGRPEIIVSG